MAITRCNDRGVDEPGLDEPVSFELAHHVAPGDNPPARRRITSRRNDVRSAPLTWSASVLERQRRSSATRQRAPLGGDRGVDVTAIERAA